MTQVSEQTQYTVFVDASDGWKGYCSRDGVTTLEGMIAAAVERETSWDATFTPVAWMYGKASNCAYERQLSIAAGRLIENINGQWVARGVEEEKVTAFIDGVLYQFSADTVEVFTQDYLLDPNAAMIARDGPAKPLVSNWIDLSSAPFSTAKPNPFASFRNPDSCNGPADHLNAARHQMAGMSNS